MGLRAPADPRRQVEPRRRLVSGTERSLERGGGDHAKPRDPRVPHGSSCPRGLVILRPTRRFHSKCARHPTSAGEAQMHISQACQSASSSADGQPSKHLERGDQVVCLSGAHAFRHVHIWTASITHYQTGAGSYFCHLTDLTPPMETRMECGGETKERREEGETQN